MGGLRRFIDALDAASETWLGWRAPPVHRAFDDAKWAPDLCKGYCCRCGDTVGPGEASQGGCAACRNGKGIGDGVVRLGRYVDDLRQWILAVKYAHWAAMGDALGRQLGDAIKAAGVVHADDTVVVPMPMPWQRRLYRGIDHAAVIAAGVARSLDAPIARCLAKTNGPPMVSLTATERAAMGGRGMSVRRRWGGWPLEGLHVVVVDDVRTTGASLRAAVRQVRSLRPARVVAAVLAVADESPRRSNAVEESGVESEAEVAQIGR